MAPYVLIAELDPKVAALYRQLVVDEGLQPIVSRDGEEAKALLRARGAPVVLLTDLSLPRADGFALLTELRRLSPPDKTPALVVSAFEELRAAAWERRDRLGILEVLPKSSSPEVIRAALRRCLAATERPPQPVTPEPDQPAKMGPRRVGGGDPESLHRVLARTAEAFRVPIAFLSLLIEGKLLLKAHVDVRGDVAPESDGLATLSFVKDVLQAREPLIVPDATGHVTFAKNALVRDGLIRSYAGVPLISSRGEVVGTLGLIDLKPLSIGPHDIDALMAAGRRLLSEVRLPVGDQRGGPGSHPPADLLATIESSDQQVAALARLALTDPLTGLTNRRGGEQAIAREVARTRRSGSPLSFVLLDVDNFKSINDRYGHATGDQVLREVSKTLAACVRGSDVTVRWGGEEFLLVLPGADAEGGRATAERVRASTRTLPFGEPPGITISAGVVELQREEDAMSAISRADAKLYEAKAEGRNQVK